MFILSHRNSYKVWITTLKMHINWIPELGSCSSLLIQQNFKRLQRKIVIHIWLYCVAVKLLQHLVISLVAHQQASVGEPHIKSSGVEIISVFIHSVLLPFMLFPIQPREANSRKESLTRIIWSPLTLFSSLFLSPWCKFAQCHHFGLSCKLGNYSSTLCTRAGAFLEMAKIE